jgi:Cu+-exporting ATPase
LAKVAALGMGRARGVLIQDPGALERAKDVDTFIFDKTGTVTEGRFSLQEAIAWEGTEIDGLQRVGAVEVHSDHFLAREILRKARELFPRVERAQSFRAHEGLGVTGLVHGTEVAVGSRQLMRQRGLTLSPDHEGDATAMAARGATVVYFGWEKRARGILVFGDTLKHGAKEVVQELRSGGVEAWLVSGDARETTQSVAQELGIDRFLGQALPGDKVEIVKSLQERGRLVGMVGDGMNDAAALAQADVGFALGTGSNLAQEASDMAIMADDPTRVLDVLNLSAMTTKTVRQNLLFAFLYNTLGIPLAMMGMVNPIVAVFAMFGSSLTVIGNTLRMVRGRSVRGWKPLPQ